MSVCVVHFSPKRLVYAHFQYKIIVDIPLCEMWDLQQVFHPMGDYRYTELSYEITSLISRTCCLGSSGLIYT